MELEDIRLKEPGELTEEEGKFLKENIESLTPEEKADYKDILGVDDEGKKKEEEEKVVTFKNQEEFDTAVDKRVKEMQTEAEVKVKEEEEEKKEKRFFPKEYKPADWDEFAKDFIGVVRKDREIYSKEQREKMADIDRMLDAETEDLRKIDPSIPVIGAKGRRDFDRSLAEIMIKDPKITSITKAYGVYKESQGDEDKKKQKDLAKKVGGGAGTGEKTKKVKYGKFAGRGMDEAEEEALKKFKTLS